MKSILSSMVFRLSVCLVTTGFAAPETSPPLSPSPQKVGQAASPQSILDAAGKDPKNYRVLQASLIPGKKDKVATYYWPVGHEIKVAFMGGTEADHQFVKESAAPWFEYANLTANYLSTPEDSEVRIRIVHVPEASYSFLGTTCLTLPKGEHTMQLSITPEGPRKQQARIVMHEFGHMLGLLAENTNPNIASSIEIDWEKFYDIAQRTWGYDKRMVDANYRLEPSKGYLYAGKPFDINSIMMHPIPPEVIKRGPLPRPGISKPELSPGDKAFISQIYPKTTPTLAETQAVINSTESEPLKKSLQKSADVIVKLETTKHEAALADTLTKPEEPAPSSTPEKVAERSKQAMLAEEEIVREYLKFADKGPAEAKEAAMKLGRLYLAARENARQEARNKAVFGLDDQYSPEVYEMIFKNAQSVGSLMTTGKERLGTCFMVGKDLMLTCHHCLKKPGTIGDTYHHSTLMVDFSNNASDPQKRFKVEKIVFQGTVHDYEGVALDPVDFALLKLGPNSANKLPSEDNINPLSINNDPEVARDVAVYVIGFPGKTGNKTVADNARIFAGFSNNRETKVAYELQAHGEAELLQKEAEALDVDEDTKLEAVKTARLLGDQIIEGFQKSFKPGSGDPPRWFLVSAMLSKTLPPHPAFALDSDTYHGNSGSPVFSRKSSDIVGVLFRGIDDRYLGVKVGWLRHEEAIPIHVILQNWKRNRPDEPALYGVQF